MARYRKKPVVIEAVQFTVTTKVATSFVESRGGKARLVGDALQIQGPFYTPREMIMTVNLGDWIIKGVAGGFDSCNPDIFAETYELVT